MLCLDVVFFLGQAAIADMNPEWQEFYTCDGSTTLGSFKDSCTNYTLPQSPGTLLPGGTVNVDPTTGNIFTDIFTSVKEWIVDTIPGAGLVLSILSGPMGLLKALKLPAAFYWAVGMLWWGATFFIIINWIFGRQGE